MTAAPVPTARRSLPWVAAAIAVVYSAGAFALFGDYDLALQDEGFLWYGVLRTAEGLVPLRDFQSYEPGRYYWCAPWTRAFGPGVLPMRAALELVRGAGLFFALCAASRAAPKTWQLLAIGAVLSAWMFPRHKLFEPAIAMAAVWIATRFVEQPSLRRHFACGLFAGASAFFGRNHALYSSLGFFLVALLVAVKTRDRGWPRKLGAGLLGAFVGALPLVSMLAFVPGFAASFWKSVVFFLEHGTNLPFPAPWPWNRRFHDLQLDGYGLACFAGLSATWLAVLAFFLFALVRAVRLKPAELPRSGLLVAGAGLGLVYLHHASVRSDGLHIGQCIQPGLLGLLAVPGAFRGPIRRTLSLAGGTLWCAALALATLGINPFLLRYHPARPPAAVETCEVAGETLRLPPAKAAYVRSIQALVLRHVAPTESIFIVPMRPTLYPLLGKVSPVWGIYFLWRASENEQLEIIDALEAQAVRWVLIVDIAVDGKTDLLFRNSHPMVWKHLQEHFARVSNRDVPQHHVFLQRKP